MSSDYLHLHLKSFDYKKSYRILCGAKTTIAMQTYTKKNRSVKLFKDSDEHIWVKKL